MSTFSIEEIRARQEGRAVQPDITLPELYWLLNELSAANLKLYDCREALDNMAEILR
jgi:hypothetical protein